MNVTYHNPSRADTWTIIPKSALVTDRQGRTSVDDDGVLDSTAAKQVREGAIASIEVFY